MILAIGYLLFVIFIQHFYTRYMYMRSIYSYRPVSIEAVALWQ